MKLGMGSGAWSLVALLGTFAICCLFPNTAVKAESRDVRTTPADGREREVASAVRDLKSALAIKDPIQISLVDHNPRLVSVERAADHKGFLLLFDKGFLGDLEPEEVRAAVAHELGHVWIFNHRPFLQTEDLANQQALKVVSRECLERVYEKASKRGEEFSFLKGALD